MEVNELRIGNYLTFKGSSRVNVKLDRFDLSAILYNESEVLHYEPIEITEEILLKCGFVKIENNWKVLDIVFASLGWERLAGMVLTLEHESVYLPHIKYLHQLQNLYFALTGEELEINL